jgi:hypothetical protein
MRMNRRTSILSAVVAIAVTTLAMVTVAFAAQEQGGGQGQEKVTICHEGHTITVGEPALAAHERHGDTEGACESATPETTGDVTTPDTTTPESTTPETTTPDTTTPDTTIPDTTTPETTVPETTTPETTTPETTTPEDEGGKGQEKVPICHEGHTITVGVPALAAHERHGDTEGACATTGQDRPRLHAGAKITLKLLRLGESQSLAEVYASDHTGFKVERAMRKGLMVFCRPGGYDTLTFTCEGATPPPLTTTPETTTPETTVPETTTPDTTVPDTTVPDTTVPVTTVPDTTVPATTP